MGYFTVISSLKGRLARCDNREAQIREQIAQKMQSNEPVFSGDWIRWRRQLKELRLRRISLKARLRRAEKNQAIMLARKQTLDAAKPPPGQDSSTPG
jgi:hypothetical protein